MKILKLKNPPQLERYDIDKGIMVISRGNIRLENRTLSLGKYYDIDGREIGTGLYFKLLTPIIVIPTIKGKYLWIGVELDRHVIWVSQS